MSENFAPKNHPKRVETNWSALEEFLHYSGISGVPTVYLSGMFDRKKNRPNLQKEKKLKNCRPSGSEASTRLVQKSLYTKLFLIEKKSPIQVLLISFHLISSFCESAWRGELWKRMR